MKTIIATAALLLATNAFAETTTIKVGSQYGSSEFYQLVQSQTDMGRVLEIRGLAAYAMYVGMKDVKEEESLNAYGMAVKTKTGAQITCRVEYVSQATCVIPVADIKTGSIAN